MGEVLLIRSQRGLRFKSDQSHSAYPYSAYELLIHHLSLLCPKEAQWWSRAKAYTNEAISPSMWGLMKVAGKRLYSVAHVEFEQLWNQVNINQRIFFSEHDLIDLKKEARRSLADPFEALELKLNQSSPSFNNIQQALAWLTLQFELSQRLLDHHHSAQAELIAQKNKVNLITSNTESPIKRRWYGLRRTVVAMLLDQHLQLIALCFNQPQQGHTSHAERRLFEFAWNHFFNESEHEHSETKNASSQSHQKLILVSSLKPCKMCAGLWLSHCKVDELEIIFTNDDLGSNGQNTAFDLNSYAYEEGSKWPKSLKSFKQIHWLCNPSSS